MAGIHGGPEGAYSIALSGGYDDNIDMGDCFTYTGEGGISCYSEKLLKRVVKKMLGTILCLGLTL